MTSDEKRGLEIARALAQAGQRVFVARPARRQTTLEDGSPGPLEWDPTGGTGGTGFVFPKGWQTAEPDPSVIDGWKRGYAVAMVTGGPLDVIDIDPRNGGSEAALAEALGYEMPTIWGRAATPSGGEHLFITSLGIGKGKPVTGVDLQAGAPDGKGRGFVFLAPTVRVSKVTGELRGYHWVDEVDPTDMWSLDDSGTALRALLAKPEREPVKVEGEATEWEIEEARIIFDQQIEKLRAAPDGDRNNTCVSVLSTLMMLVVGGCLDEMEVVERATEAAEEVGLETEEFENALASATEYAEADGGKRPEVPGPEAVFGPVVGTGAPAKGVDGPSERGPGLPDEYDPTKCEWNECGGDRAAGTKWCEVHRRIREADADKATARDVIPYEKHHVAADIHMARRIATEYLEAEVRAVGNNGWAIWNGKTWDIEAGDDKVAGRIHAACLDIHRREEARARKQMNEGTREGDGEARKKYQARMKIVDRLLSAKVIRDLTRMSRTYISISLAMFDGSETRHLLNCPNGVVNLKTGEIGPHRRGLYLTKMTGAEFVPGAKHEDWEQALTALDEKEAEYLQRRLGQGVTGYPPRDDVVTFLGGGGENGKSTVVDAVGKALGGYFSNVNKTILLEGAQKHDSLMFELKGVRLAVIEELPRSRWLDVESLKDISGTNGLKARVMRETYFTHWTATHTVVVTSNYLVKVVETDHSVWRRLERILFGRKFDGSDPDRPGDPGLRERLRDARQGQAEAVLAWLVSGAMRWFREGLSRADQPASVAEETARWRAAGNPVVTFSNEFLEYDPASACLSSDVYRAYREWSLATGTKPVGDQVFWSRMGDTDLLSQPGVTKGKAKVTDWRIRSSREIAEGSAQNLLMAVRIRFDDLAIPRFTGDFETARGTFSD